MDNRDISEPEKVEAERKVKEEAAGGHNPHSQRQSDSSL